MLKNETLPNTGNKNHITKNNYNNRSAVPTKLIYNVLDYLLQWVQLNDRLPLVLSRIKRPTTP